jgi:2-methylisocitrate lyase-like PEP mutase family enzyme
MTHARHSVARFVEAANIVFMNPREKALELHRLHQGPPILCLANVWDAASARIVESAGFPAIGTSSAGIAFSLGYADGERIPRAEMLAAVRRIAGAVAAPVTADLEAGYEDVEVTAAGLMEAGAVGLNLEDIQGGGLVDLPAQLEKIRTVRRAGERAGVPIVINARTDIYLEQIGEEATCFSRAVERLAAYRDVGADCLFIPGVRDEPTISRLVEALHFPLNILAGAGTPSARRLQDLGVARVSLGSGPMRATMALTRRIAEELRDHGAWSEMLERTIPYAEANQLMG